MMKGRVAFVVFSYVFGICENLVLAVRSLAELGLNVDIYIDRNSYRQSPLHFDNDRVLVHVIDPAPEDCVNLESLFQNDPLILDFLKANSAFPRFPLYLKQLYCRLGHKTIDLVIGVEPLGLVAAHLVVSPCARAMVYFNLELYQRHNCDSLEAHFIKDMEVRASKACEFTVIPDQRRGEVFSLSNGVPLNKLRYLPISTAGDRMNAKSGYFREKFSIPSEKMVILYAGNCIDWAYCREMAEACALWPESVELVIHTWRTDVLNEPYYRQVRDAAGPRVHLSVESLGREEFTTALSSADVGLAFYRAIDENFTEVGSSSNKLALYFRAGLPVVTSDFPSIREVVERFGCGFCIDCPEQAGPALETILSNLTKYREAAFRAYEGHYSFEVHFKPILAEMSHFWDLETQEEIHVGNC